jgi:hypothetical protein
MEQSKSYREIPSRPKKRTTVREKFTTLLMFTEKGNLNVAEWVCDSRLESNWKQLLESDASQMKELDCLSNFLLIAKKPSSSLPKRQTALAHLKCYYQETCYWETRKFWGKLQITNFSGAEIIWEWQELFDRATATFDCLKNAEKDLKSFKPDLSAKEYVKKVIFYNLSNWRDKKIGRATQIKSFSLDASLTGDIQEENPYFSRQVKVKQALAIREKLKKEMCFSKKQQERVLVWFDSELEKLEKSVAEDSQTKKGKGNFKLWIFLVLTYGLMLRQSGAAEVFKRNKIPISQATISRNIKTFVIKLQLQVFREFEGEIKETLGEGWNDEEEPIEKKIEKWKNEVNEVLKYCLQERVFTLAVMPKAQHLKQAGVTTTIDSLVRKELEGWCDRSFQISIKSEILPEKLDKKIKELVREFVEKLGVCEG